MVKTDFQEGGAWVQFIRSGQLKTRTKNGDMVFPLGFRSSPKNLVTPLLPKNYSKGWKKESSIFAPTRARYLRPADFPTILARVMNRKGEIVTKEIKWLCICGWQGQSSGLKKAGCLTLGDEWRECPSCGQESAKMKQEITSDPIRN